MNLRRDIIYKICCLFFCAAGSTFSAPNLQLDRAKPRAIYGLINEYCCNENTFGLAR